MPLFSGSGAVKIMDLYEDEPNDDYESYAMRQRMQPHGGQLMMTTQVTTKVPPGFDGKTSWFAFEDAIDDWCDITELEAEKWGPALRNRLEGSLQEIAGQRTVKRTKWKRRRVFQENTETTFCERSSDSFSL